MPLRNTVDSVRSTVSTVTSLLVEVVSTLLVVATVAGWSLFWWNVVRLNNLQGDLTAAAITTAAFIVPAIGFLVWYLGSSLGLEIATPDIDVTATQS